MAFYQRILARRFAHVGPTIRPMGVEYNPIKHKSVVEYFAISDVHPVDGLGFAPAKAAAGLDFLIVNQALEQQAKKLFSFDKKLQKKFPGFKVEKISRKDI